MGAGASSLSPFKKGLTTDELKINSKEVREMSDSLFQFMYNNSREQDILDIANNPEKYVIALSDMITTQFNVLGYTTRTGRIGEIYFKRFDDLEPPLGSDTDIEAADSRNSKCMSQSSNSANSRKYRQALKVKTETRKRRQPGYAKHKQNSEVIAFYFVRLFQLLGALLLVVKDLNIPDYDKRTGDILTIKQDNSEREFAQQMYPEHQTLPSFRKPNLPINRERLEMLEAQERQRGTTTEIATQTNRQSGGGNFKNETPLGPFEFLRYYLRIPGDRDNEIYTYNKINTKLDREKTFFLDKAKLLVFRYTQPTNPSGISVSQADGGLQELGIPATDSNNPANEVKFMKVVIKSISFETENDAAAERLDGYLAPSRRSGRKEEVYPSRVKIAFPEISGGNNTVTFQRAQFNQSSSMSNGLEYIVSATEPPNLLEFIKSSEGLNPKANFTEILEKITRNYLKQKYPSITVINLKSKDEEHDTDSSTAGTGSLKKIKEPTNKSLRDVTTVLNSSTLNYQPHCISRALQLLDPASINNFPTGSAISKVCKYSVGKSKEKTKVSDYLPTRTLGQLYGKINPVDYENSLGVLKAFVQKDSQGDPLSMNDVSKMPGESNALLSAITRLTSAFNVTYNKETHKGFGDIYIGKSSECDNRSDDIQIKRNTSDPVFNEMKNASQELLAYHFSQVVEISNFLKKIFNVSHRPDGSWKVEGPKTELLFAGFSTLDSLTDQVRELLLRYYSGCEGIYQKGLKAWENGEKKAKAAQAPVITEPSGPAPAPAPVPQPSAPVPQPLAAMPEPSAGKL
uniref:Uncharacterized protein n=1 Tax=viral metagenome TaxID=1070528 RepID=A0A6C0ANC6_9ZZZZ